MRLSILKLLVLLTLATVAASVPATSIPVASAETCETCDPGGGDEEGGGTDDQPPAIVTTTISSISPTFAWSGDTITLTGTGFTGATVTVNGLGATISSRSSTRLAVIVPTITNAIAGPMTIPVVVSSPTGTAATSFTLSPTLQLSATATFGVNAQFGQGGDGSAKATATLDRLSGFTVSELSVRNDQALWGLTVNMSTVWLDSNGTVVGFTEPESVFAGPWFPFSWPNVWSTAEGRFVQVVSPSPAAGASARSARIVLVRDHGAEFLDTLKFAVANLETIGKVLGKLAKFFA